MSVLKGEGKVPILFGSTSINVGPLTHSGYLSRPDLEGEWPTVVVIPSVWGVTSAVKDLCRRIARQGLAALALDLYRKKPPSRKASYKEATKMLAAVPRARALSDLGDIFEYIANPAGFWSSAEHGFGILGIGDGGAFAVEAARGAERAAALALCYTPPSGLDVSGLTTPMLGLYGRADDRISVDDVMALRSAAPHAELVIYDGVSHDFLDDYLDTWDYAASKDALDRLTEFFEKHV